MPEGAFLTRNMKLTEYLRETRGEMKHVTWPTKTQTVAYTVVVILISIAVGYGLGAFDFGFTFLLKTFILN
jgi:preprotein translocase SecE subunit